MSPIGPVDDAGGVPTPLPGTTGDVRLNKTGSACRCFTATATEGYPRGGEFIVRVSPRSGT
jgi:hypothetical protein